MTKIISFLLIIAFLNSAHSQNVIPTCDELVEKIETSRKVRDRGVFLAVGGVFVATASFIVLQNIYEHETSLDNMGIDTANTNSIQLKFITGFSALVGTLMTIGGSSMVIVGHQRHKGYKNLYQVNCKRLSINIKPNGINITYKF